VEARPGHGAAELPASLRRVGFSISLYFTHQKAANGTDAVVVLAAPVGARQAQSLSGGPRYQNLGPFIMRYTVTQMLQTTRRVGAYALFADIRDCQSEGEARPPVT